MIISRARASSERGLLQTEKDLFLWVYIVSQNYKISKMSDMQRSSLLLCLLAILITTTDGFVVRCNRAIQTSPAIEIPIDNGSSAVVGKRGSALSMGLFDDFGKMLKGMTARASASHILIKGGAEAAIKLEELKAEIADSPVKFADLAAEYSSCPSGRSGGTLGGKCVGCRINESLEHSSLLILLTRFLSLPIFFISGGRIWARSDGQRIR